MKALQILAGPQALAQIREQGMHPAQFSHLGAAAGGAKWLILEGLDRVLFGHWLAGRSQPLTAVGASIGAWRLAAAAQQDPLAALDRFNHAYVEVQRYGRNDGMHEITREARRILDAVLGDDGAAQIVAHPWLRLNVIVARAVAGIDGSGSVREKLALARAAFANVMARRHLGRHLTRTVLHTGEAPVQLLDDGLGAHAVPLDAAGVAPALMATAAIPGVIAGVPALPGAPAGYHLDGGLIDYHMDLPLAEPPGLVLLPHFVATVTPGWLDKFLPWRRAQHLSRTVVLAPTPELIASLPARRIPDRRDFLRYAGRDAERIAHWRAALAAGRRIGEEFAELADNGRLAAAVRPLEG
ncbi:hypothetical protein N8I74_01360 [Chitiniphilus purpureus]|uniref:Patatin-like phospholipase family protein n=1 Tax=Chitiniphilus purpureus TaxID=2981137 RepID=A0ABY6DMV9_9NEIS|nr:hypothetical protein [Chitiniphilus sp. CD1]UXY15689.1 hypothetical protein N8I74_01360 [Chitiniphilus sp. CD1]